MSVGVAIDFIIKHNVLLIEVLVGIILVSIIFLAFRAFFSRAQNELSGTQDSSSIEAIEKSLKKILETTQVQSSGPSPEALAQMDELKATLEERTRLLEEMQEQLKNGAAAAPAEGGADIAAEKMKLETRMKELEAKLAEYEIISEDIADLSMYKEENAKLKKELDALKAGGAVAAPAAATAPAATEAPAAPAAAPAAAAEAAPADAGGGIDDDIMAEFARAVEEQKASGAVAAAPAAEAPAADAAPAPDPFEAALSSFKEEETAPVAAEEPTSVPEPVPEPEPVVAAEAPAEEAPAPAAEEAAIDLGEMNLEAMVAEAADLAANAPAEAPAENALDATLDADKLAAEAMGLTTDKKKEDEQLMDQFEDFVKKGAS